MIQSLNKSCMLLAAILVISGCSPSDNDPPITIEERLEQNLKHSLDGLLQPNSYSYDYQIVSRDARKHVPTESEKTLVESNESMALLVSTEIIELDLTIGIKNTTKIAGCDTENHARLMGNACAFCKLLLKSSKDNALTDGDSVNFTKLKYVEKLVDRERKINNLTVSRLSWGFENKACY